MSAPYVGEIRMFAGNFAPVGWAFCNGQLIAISENETLFQLIGTTYGGDGQNTFALPNLQGRVPIHVGSGFIQGQVGGDETVTLSVQQMPTHTHIVAATSDSQTASLPGNNYLAAGPDIYDLHNGGGAMAASSITVAGGSQPHDNFQPYLCVNFILSLYGVFPSQS